MPSGCRGGRGCSVAVGRGRGSELHGELVAPECQQGWELCQLRHPAAAGGVPSLPRCMLHPPQAALTIPTSPHDEPIPLSNLKELLTQAGMHEQEHPILCVPQDGFFEAIRLLQQTNDLNGLYVCAACHSWSRGPLYRDSHPQPVRRPTPSGLRVRRAIECRLVQPGSGWRVHSVGRPAQPATATGHLRVG